MPACAISPENKRDCMRRVGRDLVENYGKKKYYSVAEVKSANRRQNIDIDVHCWLHAAFNTHVDFDAYHASIGETCIYADMKQQMLSSVSATPTEAGMFDFDLDLSWLEFPDIDLSFFDFLDF